MADPAGQEATANSEAREDQTAAADPVVEDTKAVKEPEKNGEAVKDTTALLEVENAKIESNDKSKDDDAVRENVQKSPDHKNRDTYSRRSNGSHRGTHHQGRNFKNSKSNNKFDPSYVKETDDPVEIRKQVEFYFSDSNLPNDKFLFSAIGGSENKPVPIETIHSFKRMRRFQPFSAIVAALKESSTLNVVENDTAIQRKTSLPEGTSSTQSDIQKVFEDQAMSRSVYVKGFGREEASSQFDIEAWFSEFGNTNQVRLRRTHDASFKGSVFVEFDSEETAKKFLAIDPPPQYNKKELIIKSKKEYCDEKVDQINSGAIRAKESDERDWNSGRAKEPDERDWKARRELDRKRGFPPLHKDGRSGHGRDGNRGRGSRYNRSRDRGRRDRRRSDDEEEVGSDADTKDKAADTKQTEDSADTKKREREGQDDGEEAPPEKKTAIESEMTGEPQATSVEKTSTDDKDSN